MKVSIVTVCFNSESTIRSSIESVLYQTYRNIEYIIVDGSSTDSTMKIVDDYRDRIGIVISEPDSGIYDAMNKGISYASGDIVGILNSDDFYESKHVIEHVVNVFESKRNVDVLSGDIVFVDSEDIGSITRYCSSSRFKPWKLRFGWMPPHPASFVKRNIYMLHGLYNLDYKIASDYEIFVRWLLVQRLNFCHIDLVLVRMRQGGISTSGLKSVFLLNREIVRACKSNGVYTNLFIVLAKFPFKLLELVRKPKRIKQ